MKDADRAFVEALRRDEESGATAIVARTAAFLGEGDRERAELLELAEACQAAQPAMAGLLAIAKIVRGPSDTAPALALLSRRLERAPASIARYAAEMLLLGLVPADGGRRALTVVTCSASAPVEATVRLLAESVDVTVCCAESRPRCEGAALARRLATAGIETRLFTDAGISSVIPGSGALLIGADAVGPETFVNKVGSGALCALAASTGVPVYVLAGREKLVSEEELRALSFPERRPIAEPHAPWPDHLQTLNPTFERVSRQLVSQLITDSGPH